MSNIKDNLLQLIGKTPLVRLSNIYKDEYGTEIIAKVEYFNPGGSVKDRAAYAMIEAAETSGKLKKGGTIIEPTSGNTGIGMAWIAALKGYRTILTMPESMSLERRKLLAFLGCEVVLTPAASGMKGALDKAEELQRNTPGSIILQQFSNSANPMVHYNTTANEIMEDSDGVFDVFVACVGTGGTITGTGKRLKELKPNVKIVAVEPESSAVLSGGQAGKHSIQGIGAGFVPDNYDSNTVDKIIQIFNKNTLIDFPSGNYAIQVETSYYQAYVVSKIVNSDMNIGAIVKYISVFPNNNGLPAYRYNIGSLYRIGETVELALPQDIEFFLKEHSAGIKGLNVTYANNKLRITLTKAPDIVNGPYGTFDLYIRSNNVFTIVEVHVE